MARMSGRRREEGLLGGRESRRRGDRGGGGGRRRAKGFDGFPDREDFLKQLLLLFELWVVRDRGRRRGHRRCCRCRTRWNVSSCCRSKPSFSRSEIEGREEVDGVEAGPRSFDALRVSLVSHERALLVAELRTPKTSSVSRSMYGFPFLEFSLVSLETTSSDSFLLCDGSMTILSGDLGELGSKVGVGFELDRSSEGGGGDESKRRQ